MQPLDGMKKHPGSEVADLYDDRMKSERMTGVSPELLGTIRVTAGISTRYKRLQD